MFHSSSTFGIQLQNLLDPNPRPLRSVPPHLVGVGRDKYIMVFSKVGNPVFYFCPNDTPCTFVFHICKIYLNTFSV